MRTALPPAMPEPDPLTTPSFQVLADPTGRRGRRLAIAGRVATAGLGLWLVLLFLGGLGLQPITGLPFVGSLGAGEAAPPALPARVQRAVAQDRVVAPATRAAQQPAATVPVPSRHPALSAPSPARTRRPARRKPTTAAKVPAHAKASPRPPATASAPTPPRHATSPSAAAPGQNHPPSPGQTRVPPGQTKTTQGPPPTTTTPGNGKGKGLDRKDPVPAP